MFVCVCIYAFKYIICMLALICTVLDGTAIFKQVIYCVLFYFFAINRLVESKTVDYLRLLL